MLRCLQSQSAHLSSVFELEELFRDNYWKVQIRNLSKFLNQTFSFGMYYVPRIDWSRGNLFSFSYLSMQRLLNMYHHLICISNAKKSVFSQHFKALSFEKVVKVGWLKTRLKLHSKFFDVIAFCKMSVIFLKRKLFAKNSKSLFPEISTHFVSRISLSHRKFLCTCSCVQSCK